MAERSSNSLLVWSVLGCAGLAAMLLCLIVPVVSLGVATTSRQEAIALESAERRVAHDASVAAVRDGGGELSFRPLVDEEGLLLGEVLHVCRAESAELRDGSGGVHVHVRLATADAAAIVSAAGAHPGARLRVDLDGVLAAELDGGASLASGLLTIDVVSAEEGRALLRTLRASGTMEDG